MQNKMFGEAEKKNDCEKDQTIDNSAAKDETRIQKSGEKDGHNNGNRYYACAEYRQSIENTRRSIGEKDPKQNRYQGRTKHDNAAPHHPCQPGPVGLSGN